MLSQKESLAEQVKKYPCLFAKVKKTDKERDVVKNACEAVASELHLIEDAREYITQVIS